MGSGTACSCEETSDGGNGGSGEWRGDLAWAGGDGERGVLGAPVLERMGLVLTGEAQMLLCG